ncbi:MAG: hypothetical protein JWP11_1141 [Frankiales bacterium]|nr:hypothetical protein [Frankiales bacterium]
MTHPPVLFTTNYPMHEARRLWRQGRYPGYHLFGTAQLEADGWPVEDLPEFRGGATRFGRAVSGRLGAGKAQSSIVRRATDDHIAYAADPVSYASLAILRSVGLWRKPIVAVVHPSVADNRVLRRALRAYDVVIALSKRIHTELIHDVGRDPTRTLWAPPGPDLSFPLYEPLGSEFVVSSGKTYRDQPTLLTALSRVQLAARVHTLAGEFPAIEESATVVAGAPYDVVLDHLRRASAVAIPLARTTGTYGITELNDALALGKPIVQTRSSYLDVDLEAVGCGWTVDAGDVSGWERALIEIQNDAGGAAERGRLGRIFAEEHWNWTHFAEVVLQAMSIAEGGGG